MQQPKKNQNSDIFTFALGAMIAAVIVVGELLITKVLWPVIKMIAMKIWNKLRNKAGKADAETKNKPEPEANAEPEAKAQSQQDDTMDDPVGNGLPVPDIFKNSPNLGRMREFKL